MPTIKTNPDALGIRKINHAALRRLRTEARLTQPQLSVLSGGIHVVTISNYETGAWQHAKEVTVLRLADGLSKALRREVDPDEFSAPLEPEPVELAS